MSYRGGRIISIDSDGNEHMDFGFDHDEPKKMTNADRIRAMTDKELAVHHSRMIGCPLNELEDFKHCTIDDKCVPRECWLDWLKQEATE